MDIIKKEWVVNQYELGDLLQHEPLSRAICLCYNNQGVHHKARGKFNLAVKSIK